MAIKLSTAVRNAMLNAITTALDAGTAAKIKIYDGTQPAGPDTAITSQVLLATFTCADPSFEAAASGSMNLDADPDLTTTGVAAGTATWARVTTSADVAVFDGSAGTAGTDFILNTATVSVGVNMTLTTGSLTQPAG